MESPNNQKRKNYKSLKNQSIKQKRAKKLVKQSRNLLLKKKQKSQLSEVGPSQTIAHKNPIPTTKLVTELTNFYAEHKNSLAFSGNIKSIVNKFKSYRSVLKFLEALITFI